MPLFTLQELVDIVIITLGVGFIFSGMIRRPQTDYDPLKHYQQGFDVEGLKFSIMATAPAVVLHEMGHKFVALLYGLQATFHASYFWLGLGVVLKLMNFGFIFFVPGFVSISGISTPLESALTALAGPLVNLLLWLFAHFALQQKWFHRKYDSLFILTKRINLFLFIFNMIPIGFFDGAKVVKGLIAQFVG